MSVYPWRFATGQGVETRQALSRVEREERLRHLVTYVVLKATRELLVLTD